MKSELANELYIGLMSGTSCDGVDASLVRTDGKNSFKIIANTHIPYPAKFKSELQKLMVKMLPFLEIEKHLTEFHIEAVNELLKQSKYSGNDIKAVGFHGQTILHDPSKGITWQIGNPHLLACATGIDVIHDFRRRDISLGGQGAPLVPVFHKLIADNYSSHPIAIINIGGVSNITYVNQKDLIAFDAGPGNALIDDTMMNYFGIAYDDLGNIASTGVVDKDIAAKISSAEYFTRPYPKSLDRNSFKPILDYFTNHEPKDILATLTYISAMVLAKAIKMLPQIPPELLLCGGGSKNLQLISFLKEILPTLKITCKINNIATIKDLEADYIESQAFAYLAARFINNLPSAFPNTTSCYRENICGSLIKS
jgi:anhydro-N-acetylmuramic acid kinase